jgi:molybdopterin-guanine dinucleotide biosynthesis adapter protein
MKVLGVSGWSGCGKTTLIVALIPRLRARGLSVSTLKHAHHDLDLDTPGKDTWHHREAGAREVLLVTGRRWALLHELREEPEPPLAALLARLQPVDLVLVEGWKTGDYPKLEIWRPVVEDRPPCFPHDATIIAVASEPSLDPSDYGRPGLPAFPLADLEGIAGFVAEFAGFSTAGKSIAENGGDSASDGLGG